MHATEYDHAQLFWRLDCARAPAFTEPETHEPGWYVAVKLVGDFMTALALLCLTWPFILLGAIFVKLTTHGPAFYSQTRLGRGGRPFRIFKLRTMCHNCESVSGAKWSRPGDQRITWIGRFLRRSHIDELPQLWNVLRGDMSLVGPRPERPEFIPDLERAIPFYRDRLAVRPGITGLAQVQLPPDTDLISVRRKLAHDIYYIRSMGAWLDFRILLATFLNVVCLGVLARVLFLPGGRRVEHAYERNAAQLPIRVAPEFSAA